MYPQVNERRLKERKIGMIAIRQLKRSPELHPTHLIDLSDAVSKAFPTWRKLDFVSL
jgi:hypothetical protein